MPPDPTGRHGLGRAAAGLRAAGLVERLVVLRLVESAPGATSAEAGSACGSTAAFAGRQLEALAAGGLLIADRRNASPVYHRYTLTGAGAAVLAAARLLGEGPP